jgi:xanthine dehydrogenase YagS FAD-binding subunit
MRAFEYASPSTIAEVIPLLGQNGDGMTRPLAGGTDLLTLMKADITAPTRLIDLKRLSDLPSGVAATDQGVSLGARTSLSEIETNRLIQQRYPALAEAAGLAATPQLRNMATLGGNLLQRPRCWYFRSPHFNCWLKGGTTCPAYEGQNQQHALFGGGPCYAVHPSDLAPALLALDAQVRLHGSAGERTLPLAEFYALPTDERRTETVIDDDELVLEISLPALPEGTRSTYFKAMDRKVWAFALVGVAAVLRLGGPSGRRIEAARLVLGGVAPIPWRAAAAEQVLIGAEAGADLFARAAEVALAGAQPLEHNGYKLPLASALIRQALAALVEQPE